MKIIVKFLLTFSFISSSHSMDVEKKPIQSLFGFFNLKDENIKFFDTKDKKFNLVKFFFLNEKEWWYQKENGTDIKEKKIVLGESNNLMPKLNTSNLTIKGRSINIDVENGNHENRTNLIFNFDIYSAKLNRAKTKLAIIPKGYFVLLWDVKNNKEDGKFFHEGRIFTAEFGFNDSVMLTASNDYTARLWDLKNKKEIARFGHNKNCVFSGEFVNECKEIKTISSIEYNSWKSCVTEWKRYDEYTLLQVLLKKILFLWLRIKKPSKSIISIDKLFRDPLLLCLVGESYLFDAWNSFEKTEDGKKMQEALWVSIRKKIELYGIDDKNISGKRKPNIGMWQSAKKQKIGKK